MFMSDTNLQARFDRQIAHLRSVYEHERQLLAYELHDGMLQELAGAKWALESVLAQVETGQPLETNLLESSIDLIANAISELRQTVLENRPFTLGQQTLAEAIEEFVSRLPQAKTIEFELKFDVDWAQLRGDLVANLFRIVQQAVHNSLAHARPSKICIRMRQTSDAINLTITDDGCGFDTESSPRVGLGLESIRERTKMFDGTCQIESQTGAGTTVNVSIPLAQE